MHQLLVVCLLVVLFSVSCSECHKDFDLVFVIDGSGSVRQAGEENWGLIKNCVKGVIAGFTIGFTQTHVAAMVFSARSYNVIEMNLNTYYNKSQIDKAIDEMVYPSGGTYTASALRKVKREILTPSQDRKDKPNVVIVITDGKATDWDQLGAAAAALHNITDTTIIAIGVALYYEKELVVMAGGQANVFTAADFEDLENMINEVKQSVCKDCRIDLVLVVDTSGSARDNWHILLKFVTDLADNVNPDPNGTHIGMVTFGDQATKIFDFREFDEGTYDRAAFFRKITSISRPAPGERTFINRGLHLANQEVLREQYGMRPDVRKVVLLITDGIQTILSDPSEPNSSEVSAAMKARGIEIACVGIGGVDGVSLDHFASSQSRVILVIYFTLLDRYVQDTSEILCPVHGGWRGWEGWRGCSVTCGGGSQTRYRSCTGPPPSNGGRDCRGSSKNTQSCNRNSCPVSPQIYLSPQNKSVPEGHPVNFSCKARGDPQPELSWKFNEGELPSGINQTKLDEGSLLELSNTTKDMEGNYKCIATNKANTTTSSAFLHVFEKPSAEVSPNPYPTLTAGDELSLTCKVNEATVKIIWKRNGGPVSPTAQIDTLQLNDKMSSKLYIAEVLEDDSGEYSCEAHNTPGVVARSTVSINVNAKLKGSIQAVSWYYIVGPVAACIFIFAMSWSVWKHRKTAMAKLTDQEEAAEMELLNVEVDKWEIAVGRILLQETIGRGAFGAVQRALLSEPDGKPGNRTVAAKCFTPTAGEDGRKSLMREIELGKLLGEKPHSNIVKFIGCVTTRVHPILVMEYCACGDLLGYLRKSRGIHDKYHLGQGSAEELQIYDLVLFARQIAAGMVFLGSRGIIHRDLAARNVLLDDNYVCKVTDFGLAYQDFKYGHGNAKKGCIPIKWTAPEILSGNFAALSTLSDVWSYGIVLYEIFTIGGIPYPGFSEGQAVAEVLNGYQMPKPEHIDDQLFDVMTRCWNRNPDFRPNFENLRQRMDAYLKEETYTELINMKRYDGAKYSKVDDLGAEDELPELPSVQAKTSSTGKKLEKWSSVR